MKLLWMVMVLVLGVAGTAVTVAVSIAEAAPAPEFKLGFRALADQIPSAVGRPLENEHFAANGDSLQQTTTGLLVWRKADNSTAFTNGSATWVNGPMGLQERPNNKRFDWERQARVDSTEVIAFQPAGVQGPDKEGYCWTESLASGQGDAWRCMVGNSIYDPCFTIEGESGSVACGASPTGDQFGFRVKLTKPLPQRTVQPSQRPWVLEIADGVVCSYMTGATTGVDGERANYGCPDGWFILGDPKPGPVWTANQVNITMTAQGPKLLDSVKVYIEKLWQ